MSAEIFSMAANWLLTGIGTIALFLLNSFRAQLKDLISRDQYLEHLIKEHREDTLVHYVRTDVLKTDLGDFKKDLMGRVDRLENTLLRVLRKED